jgi:hypothetical protein
LVLGVGNPGLVKPVPRNLKPKTAASLQIS